MGRWRESRLGLVVAGLALLCAAPGITAAAGVRNPWVLGAAAGLAAIVAVIAVVKQERYKRRAQRRDERDFQVEDGCLVLGGRLPRVREITDVRKLGVHRAATLTRPEASGPAETVPPYVPRDFDEELRNQISSSGFVLLVGDSTAGKNRAAVEAMIAEIGDHVLIAPQTRDAVEAAVGKAEEIANCVLWFDDLHKYVGSGGLVRGHIARITAPGKHHRIIVATLRASEEERLTGSALDGDASRRMDEAGEVLEQAYRIDVLRMFSDAERERAEEQVDDPRVAEALDHADEYGIAEYLAAGPHLWDAWQSAWHSASGANPHVRGAALTAAAVDIRRAGFNGPIPRQFIDEVHAPYIAARVGPRAHPEDLDDAWAWATEHRRATAAVITLTKDDHVEVFDYLLDRVQRDAPPGDHVSEEVIRAALGYANDVDQMNISDIAWNQGRYVLARDAVSLCYQTRIRKLGPEHQDTLTSRNDLAFLLGSLGRYEEAESELRAVCDIQMRLLGPEHPDTLTSRNTLALVLSWLGRYEEAEIEQRAEFAISMRVFGPEDPGTLTSRNNLARLLGELGRYEDAESELRAVLEIAMRVLGPEHPRTLMSRNNLAQVLGELGRYEEAESELRAVYESQMRVFGPEYPGTLICRINLTLLLSRLGRFGEAEDECRTAYEGCVRVHGPEHPVTLVCRNALAQVLRDMGRYEEAEPDLRVVCEIQTRVLGPEHPDTLNSRSSLGLVLEALGRHEEAEGELRAAYEGRVRILGPEHPHTIRSRDHFAKVVEALDRRRPDSG